MDKRSIFLLLWGVLFCEARSLPRYSSRVSQRSVNSSHYDFVIVGGGVSGLTVADRLTEDPTVNVLVIEAGPFDNEQDGILVPGDWDPYPYVWPGLATEPLTALNNRTPAIVTARVTGGGSTINAMNWVRGTTADFHGWETLGNEGWGWNDMLPYYIKSENFTEPDASFAAEANISWIDSVHGHSGPVQTSFSNYYYPGSANWWNAGDSVGIHPAPDPNSGVNIGFYSVPKVLNATNQTRCDARIAHYDRVIATRPNYHLLVGYTVSKILFDGTQATGVQYLPTAGGNMSTVYASKEVVLAAGALHTPQILQLSGIGPKPLLESLDIPVISDLPGVGSNLQDQASLDAPYNFTNNVIPNADTFVQNSTYNAEQLALYNEHRSSAYTIIVGLSTTFASLSFQGIATSNSTIIADAQAYDPSLSLPSDVDPTVLAGYEAQRKILLDEFQSPNNSVATLFWNTAESAQVVGLRPFSRGQLTINSTDPLANPVIDYRTATDPTDFALLVATLRKLRQVMAAPDMAVLGPVPAAPLGEEVQSDDDIIAVIRETLVVSAGHSCCSAPMQPRELGGVVDPVHKVYGVSGLRIADISYFPIMVSAGPTASVYASGEKIADIIKEEYGIS